MAVKPAGATKSYGAGTNRAGRGVANRVSEKSAGDERVVPTCLTFLCSDGDTINEMAGQWLCLNVKYQATSHESAVYSF